jgi:hypothetical protein
MLFFLSGKNRSRQINRRWDIDELLELMQGLQRRIRSAIANQFLIVVISDRGPGKGQSMISIKVQSADIRYDNSYSQMSVCAVLIVP